MEISYRRLFDMRDVLFDKEWLNKQKENFILYEMRRSVKENGNLRYDITIIFGKKLGVEYNKTLGHYHPHGFPEIYEVIKGEAIYLLQKPTTPESNKIVDTVAIYARKGDQIILPPNYGHVTINPSSQTLVMANIVSSNFVSNYEPYKRFGGACYFFTENGWIKNPNYEAPPLREIKAKRIYDISLEEMIDKKEKIEWLENPHCFSFERFIR